MFRMFGRLRSLQWQGLCLAVLCLSGPLLAQQGQHGQSPQPGTNPFLTHPLPKTLPGISPTPRVIPPTPLVKPPGGIGPFSGIELTTAQKKQLETIQRKYAPQFKAFAATTNARLKAEHRRVGDAERAAAQRIRDQQFAEIRTMLTSAQRQRFDANFRTMQANADSVRRALAANHATLVPIGPQGPKPQAPKASASSSASSTVPSVLVPTPRQPSRQQEGHP